MSNFNGVASVSSTNLLPLQAQYDANNNCTALIGQGGNALYAPINASTFSVGNSLVASSTLPTIASGFGTNPTITALNTMAFKVVVGTGGASSGTITMPSAPNGWVVNCQDVTSYATTFALQSYSSSTSISVAAYSITTGLATTFTAGDVLLFTATAY